MKRISFETVEKYWQKINTQPDEGAILSILKELYDQQPLIMVYLMAADKESLNEDEHQMMYYLGSFIAHVMLRESPPIAEVTEEQWENVRVSNLRMLEFLAKENNAENFRRSMDDVMEANNQAELFAFVEGVLMSDPECQRKVRKENTWRVFTHLKVVIDCLDKAAICP